MSEQDDLRAIVRGSLARREEERERAKQPHRTQEQSKKQADDKQSYRFLNPYNFVRYLPEPSEASIRKSVNTRLLAHCEPPPHDRYLGLTGRITCTIEAVTPLFISDSHAITTEDLNGKKHRCYRFFEYQGEPAIPASTLRGMIRSVYEAVTNSCFVVFDGKRRLEYREQPRYGNQVKGNPGIVRRLAQPSADDVPGVDGEIGLCQVAQVGAYYDDARRNVLGHKPNGEPWQSGDRVVARAIRRKKDWLVTVIAETRKALGPLQTDRLGRRESYVEGWLKITGRGEDTNKRSETLFLDPRIPPHSRNESVAFSYEVQQDYNFVLDSQIQLGNLPAKPQPEALRVEDLVWVDVVKQRGQRRARRIVRVQVPRVPYRQTIGQLLPSHLRHCGGYETLCPACRVFGWVHEKPPEGMERTAYAGRVRLTHATVVEGTAYQCDDEITLAILSSPKPTTTQFYLLDRKGQPNAMVTYDTKGAGLRGRKLYRHFGSWEEMTPDQRARFEQEYRQAANPGESGKSDQNRTVRNVLKPGAQFTFTLEFENLTPVELGALLWVLELEEGDKKGYHRLGFAKPLGFGSVKLEIEALKIMDPLSRYTSLSAEGGWYNGLPQKAEWIKKFRGVMAVLYAQSFNDLPNVRDVMAVLGEPPVLPIHYPRPPHPPDHKPDPKGKNFEWFVGNKRGPKLALKLAEEDTEGLPLIDKRGRKWR